MKRSVSVVVVFNDAKETIGNALRSAIEALENSSLVSEYEIIAVDDASTDGSADIVASRFASVKLLRLQKRHYYVKAANKGLYRCSKEITLLMTAGIALPTDYFDALLPLFDKADTFSVSAIEKDAEGEPFTSLLTPNIKKNRIAFAEGEAEGRAEYTIAQQRGNLLMERKRAVALGCLNDMYYSEGNAAESDLVLRAWGYNQKSYFCVATHCTLIGEQQKYADTNEENESAERDFNDFLMHRLFLRRSALIKFRIKSFLYFLTSILVPVGVFAATRKTYLRYIRNYGDITNAHRWNYCAFEVGLNEISRRYF